ncbi:hypothetical protein TNIN_377571 [Trichonephila inaurata madagascariensis]|uniref:Uncharacterized protein n=1 Tax=Trichonephila inaurata madagascariensis TaxID=2747483 RepID=A0A8X7CHM6_9ARAC|nr:hypothetical protein TNIN_377571 [Trichonephila inaurata madagascariensis]
MKRQIAAAAATGRRKMRCGQGDLTVWCFCYWTKNPKRPSVKAGQERRTPRKLGWLECLIFFSNGIETGLTSMTVLRTQRLYHGKATGERIVTRRGNAASNRYSITRSYLEDIPRGKPTL